MRVIALNCAAAWGTLTGLLVGGVLATVGVLLNERRLNRRRR